MAYTTIDNPELYFQAKLYTGNGSDGNAITLDGDENMQPDFLWIKERSTTNSHRVYDSVRGVNAALLANDQNAEDQYTAYGQLESFDSDGFTVGAGTSNGAGTNASSATIVAWCWKAGTSFSNDASATSVGTIDSTGSINTTAGFSIISYTGTGSAGTVAHGLASTPQAIIIKNRTDSSSSFWGVYHHSSFVNASDPNVVYLNSDGAASDDTNVFGTSTTFSSTVFSVGDYNGSNGSSNNIIGYCFSEKQGFSKFGSYEGNGNADGTFVYLGFRPAWLMVKPIDAADNWVNFDNKRLGFNSSVSPYSLHANKNFAETTDTGQLDFLSNGFKIRNSGNTVNRTSTFIYMAFAEAPFVNSNGVPANAR